MQCNPPLRGLIAISPSGCNAIQDPIAMQLISRILWWLDLM